MFQIVDASLEQSEQDQFSSSYLNFTTSTNIDQQSINQQNVCDIDQPPSSDDEEDLNHLSVASPGCVSQHNSPMMFQNEITPSFTTEENKSSSTKQYENDSHKSKGSKKPSSAIKRKREQHQNSSQSITTTKQSTRLAAKRIRVE